MSDRIAVLRDGKLVATLAARDAPIAATLAELMVGRDVRSAGRASRTRPGDVVCVLDRVVVERLRAALDGVSLSLRAGEITGDRRRVGQRPAGARRRAVRSALAPTRGAVTLRGSRAARATRARGSLPASRACPRIATRVGAIGDLPLWENAIAERYRRRLRARRHRAPARARARMRARIVERFDVRAGAGLDTPARSLSGGNMQKLILGRALSGTARDPATHAPVLIVANQPTWGLDVGAVAFVHQQLLDACARGAAVLLISEDLDEILALADRIAVMHAGRLTERGRRANGRSRRSGSRWRGRPRTEARACGLSRAAQLSRAAAASRRRSPPIAFTLVVASLLRRLGRRADRGAPTR